MFVTILVDNDHIAANVLTDCHANTIPAKDNSKCERREKENNEKLILLIDVVTLMPAPLYCIQQSFHKQINLSDGCRLIQSLSCLRASNGGHLYIETY